MNEAITTKIWIIRQAATIYHPKMPTEMKTLLIAKTTSIMSTTKAVIAFRGAIRVLELWAIISIMRIFSLILSKSDRRQGVVRMLWTGNSSSKFKDSPTLCIITSWEVWGKSLVMKSYSLMISNTISKIWYWILEVMASIDRDLKQGIKAINLSKVELKTQKQV